MNKITFFTYLIFERYDLMGDLNEEQQQILFDKMKGYNIERKIKYFFLKRYYAPIKNLNKDEYERLIFGNDLYLNEIILIILIKEDYNKLEEIKEKNPNVFLKNPDSTESGSWLIPGELIYLYETIINLYNYYSFIYEKTGKDYYSDYSCRLIGRSDELRFLLFKDIDINESGKPEKIYDFILNNEILKNKLTQACFVEEPAKDDIQKYINKIEKIDLLTATYDSRDRYNEKRLLYLKLLDLDEFKEKLYKIYSEERIKQNPPGQEYFYENLPQEKRFFIGIAPRYSKNYNYYEKLYMKYYPELSEESIYFITLLHINSNSGINRFSILKEYEKNKDFINKLMIFFAKFTDNIKASSLVIIHPLNKKKKIDKKNLDFKLMTDLYMKYMSSFVFNYPKIFNKIIELDNMEPELIEKLDFIFRHNKFLGINTLEDLNNITIEELKTAKYDSINKQSKTSSIRTSPTANYDITCSFVKEGFKGVIQIKKSGEIIIQSTIQDEGHLILLSKLYDRKNEKNLNYDIPTYVSEGIKQDDIIILYEGNMVQIYAPEILTQEQYNKIIDLIEISEIKNKLEIFYNIISKDGEDEYPLNDEVFMSSEMFFEQCNHINVLNQNNNDNCQNNVIL